MKANSEQLYHQYVGGECVARYPMHSDGGGYWFTGPITLTEKDGKPFWDESQANTLFIPRQKTEALAIRAIRYKLGEQPPGVGPGEGWGTIEAEKRAAKMGLREMAAKGLLGEA